MKKGPIHARYIQVLNIRIWIFIRSIAPIIPPWSATTTRILLLERSSFLRRGFLRYTTSVCWQERTTLNWWNAPKTAGTSTAIITVWMKLRWKSKNLWCNGYCGWWNFATPTRLLTASLWSPRRLMISWSCHGRKPLTIQPPVLIWKVTASWLSITTRTSARQKHFLHSARFRGACWK